LELDIAQIGCGLKRDVVAKRTILGLSRQMCGPRQICEILQWCSIGSSGVVVEVIDDLFPHRLVRPVNTMNTYAT